MSVTIVEKLDELKKILSANRRFFLYSAGFATGNFLQSLNVCKIPLKAEGVLVTNAGENPGQFWNIPVIQYDKTAVRREDCILLTVSERFKEEIITHLGNCPAELIYPSPAVFYYDVLESIKPFTDNFPKNMACFKNSTF